MAGCDPSPPTQEQMVSQAHTGLFTMLAGFGQTSVLCPRLEFVSTFLEEAVLSGRELARTILQPLQHSLVMQLVKIQPQRFSMELLLKLFDNSTNQGRKNAAKTLCLMRNSQALKKASLPES